MEEFILFDICIDGVLFSLLKNMLIIPTIIDIIINAVNISSLLPLFSFLFLVSLLEIYSFSILLFS